VFLGEDRRREEAPQVVRVALLLREGQPLVVPRVPQQRVPAVARRENDRQWCVGTGNA
jgi:hypothetical protein